jgi:hypothetical protein
MGCCTTALLMAWMRFLAAGSCFICACCHCFLIRTQLMLPYDDAAQDQAAGSDSDSK